MERTNPNILTTHHVHCIGIGGIGISALARLLLHEGVVVSGTNDIESPHTLDALRKEKVSISLDTNPAALPEADCYVYSDAWVDNFPEVVEGARATGKPTYSYFEALGQIANQYYLIAVSGAHGKTTTTAMLVDVLEEAGLDPTAAIGSLRTKTKSNFRAGKSKYFVVEADEYRRHFHVFTPDILVILNIDADHLDYYTDLADIQDAFRTLAERVPEEGFVACDPSDPTVAPVLTDVSATVVDYPKRFDPTLSLKVPGVHNLMNAAAVLGVAEALDIDPVVARYALKEFSGTWRRSEYLGETSSGALVFDDYAHHPKEIAATIAAFRERYPKRRLVVAFQPHLHSRTKVLFDDFVSALSAADVVVLAPIHEARKEADHSVSSVLLADTIGSHAQACSSYEEVAAYLTAHTGVDDLILTMGAGAINTVAHQIVTS